MSLHTKIQDFEHDEYKQDIYHYSISSFVFSLKFLRLLKPQGVELRSNHTDFYLGNGLMPRQFSVFINLTGLPY